MGGPIPPDAVLPLAASDISHPGPAYGNRERVSQSAISGKYSSRNQSSSAETSSSSRVARFLAMRTSPSTGLLEQLSIYYQNVRGLRTKIDDFFLAVTSSTYDVIVLTETWLDDAIYSAQLFGDAFSVFRRDRGPMNSSKLRGGGVLIAVTKRLTCFIDPACTCFSLEQLWVKIRTRDRIISIGAFYLPPDRKAVLEDLEKHIDSIGTVHSQLGMDDYALLFGDYNQTGLVWKAAPRELPSIDWTRSSNSTACSVLLEGFSFHGLTQLNTVMNQNARLLDLVLSNDCAVPECRLFEAIDPLTPLDTHHPALEINVSLSSPVEFDSEVETPGLDFRRTNLHALDHALSQIDWSSLESLTDVDDIVDFFTRMLHHAMVECVPPHRPLPKPPWSNARLRQLKRLRSSALHTYSRSRCVITKLQFSRASKEYRLYNRLLYKRYVYRTQNNLRRYPKQFWSFVKSKRKDGGLPTEIKMGDISASTALEKCNLFAAHFKLAFLDTVASASQIEEALQDTPRDVFHMGIFEITDDQICTAISKLKNSTATGRDGIPSYILKNCSNRIIYPLKIIFNASLQQGKFPTSWKTSTMFPVYKKNDKRLVENYRGITSLCACSKLFEIIVNQALFASCRNYISPDQHGFFPKRSVSTNLVQFVSTCLRCMESGAQIDAVYTDLKAAFDRVDHGILIARMEKLGATSAFVQWLRSYLTNRELYVKIGSDHSTVFSNLSGVPQGSNLGPLLFSLFINEIASLLPPGCRLFYADDVKIYTIVQNLIDCLRLQRFVNCFEEWSRRNSLTLSIQKCNIITFHRKKNPIVFDYTIANQILERVESIMDLGVKLDNSLSFRQHFSELITKANRQLGFVLKIASDFRDPYCLRSLYYALVRSILESSVVVWCPFQAYWIARIEAVQKRFIRQALRHLPWRDPNNLPAYEDRCLLLGMETLERRRFAAQAVFIAKILTGAIDCPAILAELQIYAPERVLRTRNFLNLGTRSVQYGQHDPVRFMSARFNEVYEYFDFNSTVAAFQRRLSRR